jgi:hypothetical protein
MGIWLFGPDKYAGKKLKNRKVICHFQSRMGGSHTHEAAIFDEHNFVWRQQWKNLSKRTLGSRPLLKPCGIGSVVEQQERNKPSWASRRHQLIDPLSFHRAEKSIERTTGFMDEENLLPAVL